MTCVINLEIITKVLHKYKQKGRSKILSHPADLQVDGSVVTSSNKTLWSKTSQNFVLNSSGEPNVSKDTKNVRMDFE